MLFKVAGIVGHRILRLCQRIVNGMKCENIKLVAFDFDLTLVRIHTQGRWTGSAETLSKYLRPIFVELIVQCSSSGSHSLSSDIFPADGADCKHPGKSD